MPTELNWSSGIRPSDRVFVRCFLESYSRSIFRIHRDVTSFLENYGTEPRSLYCIHNKCSGTRREPCGLPRNVPRLMFLMDRSQPRRKTFRGSQLSSDGLEGLVDEDNAVFISAAEAFLEGSGSSQKRAWVDKILFAHGLLSRWAVVKSFVKGKIREDAVSKESFIDVGSYWASGLSVPRTRLGWRSLPSHPSSLSNHTTPDEARATLIIAASICSKPRRCLSSTAKSHKSGATQSWAVNKDLLKEAVSITEFKAEIPDMRIFRSVYIGKNASDHENIAVPQYSSIDSVPKHPKGAKSTDASRTINCIARMAAAGRRDPFSAWKDTATYVDLVLPKRKAHPEVSRWLSRWPELGVAQQQSFQEPFEASQGVPSGFMATERVMIREAASVMAGEADTDAQKMSLDMTISLEQNEGQQGAPILALWNGREMLEEKTFAEQLRAINRLTRHHRTIEVIEFYFVPCVFCDYFVTMSWSSSAFAFLDLIPYRDKRYIPLGTRGDVCCFLLQLERGLLPAAASLLFNLIYKAARRVGAQVTPRAARGKFSAIRLHRPHNLRAQGALNQRCAIFLIQLGQSQPNHTLRTEFDVKSHTMAVPLGHEGGTITFSLQPHYNMIQAVGRLLRVGQRQIALPTPSTPTRMKLASVSAFNSAIQKHAMPQVCLSCEMCLIKRYESAGAPSVNRCG
ncbi:uncharacterized protein BO72DRAFT_513528 [Aspergillus fijiensis CBS 313.89]|uniref:Uncharacterized protein n=1 Tax=Aspergillus fijiensis CBS 313.89 TaxID=1448319 RepID=A0A8G1VWS0_9EURO|nr:uncharacterized protein BO72DRAFT_513528 [Aspergillus fijiensis CBS 313.89]RAK75482.1 hypothetical protein BO72DRAFT_513528 [Aspergillus fijiensis CBS 313.89]